MYVKSRLVEIRGTVHKIKTRGATMSHKLVREIKSRVATRSHNLVRKIKNMRSYEVAYLYVKLRLEELRGTVHKIKTRGGTRSHTCT